MLEFIFFDLYGTLAAIATDEAAPRTSEAFQVWLADHYGPHAARAEVDAPLARALEDLGRRCAPGVEPDIAPTLERFLEEATGRTATTGEIAACAQAFRAASRHHLHLFPGVFETLATLGSHVGLGLISNAQSLFTRPELSDLGLEGRFSPDIISSEVGYKKPAPEIFASAIEQAGVRPERALHVGNDPRTDVDGAARCGLWTCLVRDETLPGRGTVEPNLVVDSVAELPDLLFSSRGPLRIVS